jgi:hypothetical protein
LFERFCFAKSKVKARGIPLQNGLGDPKRERVDVVPAMLGDERDDDVNAFATRELWSGH